MALDPACSTTVMSGDSVSVQSEASRVLLRHSRTCLRADASSEGVSSSPILSVGVVAVQGVAVSVVPQVTVAGEVLSSDQVGDVTLVLDQSMSVPQVISSLLRSSLVIPTQPGREELSYLVQNY